MAVQPPDRKDEDVLEEIRTRFSYATNAWRKIREEGQKDIRCVAGDPWADKDRKAREDAGRPCLSLDELGQYTNQVINDVRQNKRGVKVTPIGDGANDKTAEFRQNLIRQIEYRSNASDVYTGMFEEALQRSYGFARIKAKYVSDSGFDQELVIEALPNPDLVTVDPDDLSPTAKGIQYAFIHESRSIKQFKKDFPDASITDFSDEIRQQAPDWIKDERLMIAEYWTIEYTRRQLLLVDGGKGQPPKSAYADDLAVMPAGKAILKHRWVDVPYVCQYLTNGVELLAKKGDSKKTPWPGKTIPIVACYGKALWVNSGSGTERRLLSMVRLARDPYMLYCYYRTCEAELVGMTPKTPFVGYVGQFRGQEDQWQKVNHEPVPYLQANALTEATGGQVLPLPQRQPYEPPIQSLELGAEAARRAIQAAMGISPLPTQAQRQNEKSGKALKQIEESGQKGSYHFVDHYDASIVEIGAKLDDLIPHYYDAARDLTIRAGNDEPKQIRINDPQDEQAIDATAGQHDVTLSVGPAYASQRDAASDFADSLAQNQQVFPLIADLVVKLKQLGPIGDEIADRLTPPQFRQAKDGQPPSPADVANLQGQLQQTQQQLQEATKPTAVEEVRQRGAIQIKQMDLDFQREKLHAESARAIEVARINAAKQVADTTAEAQEERLSTGLELQHEAVQNEHDRQHEAALEAMKHANTLEQGAQAHD